MAILKLIKGTLLKTLIWQDLQILPKSKTFKKKFLINPINLPNFILCSNHQNKFNYTTYRIVNFKRPWRPCLFNMRHN